MKKGEKRICPQCNRPLGYKQFRSPDSKCLRCEGYYEAKKCTPVRKFDQQIEDFKEINDWARQKVVEAFGIKL